MRPGDTLVLTRLDRLGRNLHETVTTIADLAKRDINVQVLDPALDTSRSADKVVVKVMASLAEWERELLVERTREGVAHARAQGRVAGPEPKLTDEQARQNAPARRWRRECFVSGSLLRCVKTDGLSSTGTGNRGIEDPRSPHVSGG